MSDEELHAQMQDEIGRAVEGAAANHEQGFVTKWVAVVESVGSDGQGGLWLFGNSEGTIWERLGLLEYAKACEQARITAREVDGG